MNILIILFFVFIGPEIYVDADSSLSNLELGTIEHPYRRIDDAFRELFNRQ